MRSLKTGSETGLCRLPGLKNKNPLMYLFYSGIPRLAYRIRKIGTWTKESTRKTELFKAIDTLTFRKLGTEEEKAWKIHKIPQCQPELRIKRYGKTKK